MKKTIIVMLILITLFLFFGCTQTQGGFMALGNETNDSNKTAVFNNLDEYKKAKSGDIVKVDYIGRFEDNTIFDSSKTQGRKPLEFEIDAGSMIKGFNDAVKGMKVGETKTVTLPPSLAYGERDESKIISFDANNFAEFSQLKVGMQVSGGNVVGIVVEKNDTNAKIDFNSKMAGKTLIFEITLIEIVE